jgi:putative transposase
MKRQPLFRRSVQLTDARILHDSTSLISQQFSLHAEGYSCRSSDLWQILLTAAARKSTIEAVCADLLDAPHANTVRGCLHQQLGLEQIGELESGFNLLLQRLVPDWLRERPREIALDLHDEPYYGQSNRDDPDNWVCRGEARAGTTHFYRCATAYLMLQDARFTLAVVFVKPGDALVSIVERLLALVAQCGVRVSCLYADKGFCSVAVLRFLSEQGYAAIIPAPLRGKRGGTRALCEGHASHWTTHTFRSDTQDSLTVPIAAARVFTRHHGRRKAGWCLYVCLGVRATAQRIHRRYSHRFGIESSYRIMEQARARITSLNAALRFLLMGLALFLGNMWLRCHWLYLRVRGAGRRRVARERFRFDRLLRFLSRAVERIYGTVSTISLPAP